MKKNPPVVSICIPTYNRANLLQLTLESITVQSIFTQTNDIEIVISDNYSDDETQAISQNFCNAFPGKIKYYRQSETISPDINFEFVMSKGSGTYLKLHNDNLVIRDGALEDMVKIFQATVSDKPIVFFTNGNMKLGEQIEVLGNINDFVRRVSYFSTWIGGFGMWRDEFHAISDITRNAHLRLLQTDVIFRLLAAGKCAVVVYETYFYNLPVGRKGGYNQKGGYNIAEVFGKNYLQILKSYLQPNGLLDNETFQAEKKSLLLNHIIPYYFDTENDFQKTGFFPYMQDYLHDDYFYQAIEQLAMTPKVATPATPPTDPVEERHRKLSTHWRTLNSHNETILLRAYGFIDFDKIRVGRRSYGDITIWMFGDPAESLTIGNFVSIAEDVKFLLGGNHPVEGFSTFPFLAKYFGTIEAKTKGPIVIGDDVWIGYHSIILSGVTIGQGAVIAAGSVVTKDVPPYSIVGGNPAKLIKYRFSPEIISKMQTLNYNNLTDQNIIDNRKILYTPITEENVDAIIAILQT